MIEIMKYSRYKKHYADCEVVPGTYDKISRTIKVLVPENRKKPSGTRGQRYIYPTFHGVEKGTGRPVSLTVKAICRDNAIKRLPDTCIWDLEY